MKENFHAFYVPPLYPWRDKGRKFCIHWNGLLAYLSYMNPRMAFCLLHPEPLVWIWCSILFSPCTSFSEVNRSLKWTVMKRLTHRKSVFLTSLVISWVMARCMTVYISFLLFPWITVDVLITFLNDCSQRWLEKIFISSCWLIDCLSVSLNISLFLHCKKQ